VKDRIEQFMTTLATGDLEASFAVCPIYVHKAGIKDPSDRAFNADHAQKTMFRFMKRQAALESADTIVATDPKTWLRFVEPPSKFSADELAFEMPDGEGPVLINVGLDGEVSDITAKFLPIEDAGRWHLCFSTFDIM